MLIEEGKNLGYYLRIFPKVPWETDPEFEICVQVYYWGLFWGITPVKE